MIQSLIEREEELGRVESALADASTGGGRMLVIAGPPGIGKTALLRTVRELGSKHGMALLYAGASELERDAAFGVSRQLLEPLLATLSPTERDSLLAGASRPAVELLELLPRPAAVAPDTAAGRAASPLPLDPHARLDAIVHGLFCLLRGLAERSSLLIGIDDAQWCDPPSWRFLTYLARRIEDMPIALVVVARASETDAAKVSLPELDAAGEVLALHSLSTAGSSELVRGRVSGEAHPAFCEACHTAAGGNPFLLHELVEQLRADGIEPTEAAAGQVRGLLPAGVARAVLGRLGRLGRDATAAAQAAAVLGAGAHLRWVIALAELSQRAAAEAIDVLVAAGIARYDGTVELAHPLTRSAVYDGIPTARRGLMHLGAARILRREGAGLDRVASHLLLAPAAGDRAVMEGLRQAAALADSRGAPAIAVRYLERALAEPPPPDLRPALTADLGRAQIRASDQRGVENLARALSETAGVRERAALGLDLGRSMVMVDRPAEALEVFRRARAQLGSADPELAAMLEAEEVGTGLLDVSTADRAIRQLLQPARRVAGSSLGVRVLLAYEAYFSAARGAPWRGVLDAARRALGNDGLLSSENWAACSFAVMTLVYGDRFGEALGQLDSVVDKARADGSTPMFVLATWMRANVHYRRGSLLEAEADARDALAGQDWFAPPVAFLGDVLIARGALEDAEAEFARRGLTGDEPFPNLLVANLLLDTRGRLRCAQGRWEDGLADLLAVGKRLEAWGIINPAGSAWRSNAALAYAALGEIEAARVLSAEEVSFARAFGAPRAIGVALRAAGLVAEPRAGLELLGEAVKVLERSDAQLEHGRALIDYGAALRRRGHRTEARDALLRGLDLTSRCGATALASRAREELVAAGARPRRERISGAAALTASERRVAVLAAEGMTNREIAQALFITIKTVKAHLGHVYSKLDVRTRDALPAALVAG